MEGVHPQAATIKKASAEIIQIRLANIIFLLKKICNFADIICFP
jgi:hypothetical protein